MLDLPPHIREFHNLMDDFHGADTIPYDYLRDRFQRPTIAETFAVVLEETTRLSLPLKNESLPYIDKSLRDAVNYGLYTTRTLGRWFPRSSLQFHDDMIAALPTYAEERCKVAHRSLRMMDSTILWRPGTDEAVVPELLVSTAAQITESLRHGHKGDYVIDVAEGHAVAHLRNFAKADLAGAIVLRGALLDRLSDDNPLREMLAAANLSEADVPRPTAPMRRDYSSIRPA